MKKFIRRYAGISAVLALLTGCWGIQESYDYRPVNTDPHINMTVWEFIEARQDTFSYLKQAIEYVDAAYPGFKDCYTQTDKKYTFLLLNNAGFTGTSGVFRYFGVSAMESITPAALGNMLLYHTVNGHYHCLDISGTVNFKPVSVISALKLQKGVLAMKVNNTDSRTSFSRLIVTDYLGTARTAATSNLLATNGVIHVFSSALKWEAASSDVPGQLKNEQS
jgi:hypothetical protein